MNNQTRIPMMLAMTLLLVSGGVRVESGGGDGWAFISVGFLVMGIWLASELHDKWHDISRHADTVDDQQPPR